MASKLGSDGQQLCVRDRCKRWRDLSKYNLCGGHQCPTPLCPESKSSTEEVCDKHMAQRSMPLPKKWEKVALQGGITLFLNTKDYVAQYNHPGPKEEGALKSSSRFPPPKPKKGYPTLFMVEPQPENLPPGWERVIAVDDLSGKEEIASAPQILFRNQQEHILQSADPSPEVDDNLPAGWRLAYDPDGDLYYVDENSDFSTYDDPRIIEPPVEAKSLSTHKRRLRKDRSSVKRKSKTIWNIGPCDVARFEALDFVLSKPEDIPEVVRNKTHNRYMDIIPNPKTIVTLAPYGGDPTSEYINGNYIRAWNNDPKFYIGVQGPQESNVGHFWRMLWEHRANAVVMVTGLLEKGKSKCERYWPSEPDGKSALTFDDITVVNVKSMEMRGYVINFLKATRGGESHNVLHYWYNTWPDHGVPRTAEGVPYVDDLIGMIKHLEAACKKRSAPIVVHCSAGVGRTGTIIAIDHALKMLDAKGEADPISIVRNIRQDRCALVQHSNQFELLFEACVRYSEMCKHDFKVGEAPKVEQEAELTDEQLAALRQKEKADAAKRLEEASVSGGRKRLMSAAQIDGALRLTGLVDAGEKYSFVDVDGDGRMDWREAQLQGMSRELFDRLDANRDGTVTRQEWVAYIKANRK